MIRLKDFYHSEQGGLNYVNIILILILIAIVFGVWIFGVGTYHRFTLGHFAEGQAIKASEITDQQAYASIMKKAEELGIDMATFELSVQRMPSEMVIEFGFLRPVTVPGFSGKNVKFRKTIRKAYTNLVHLEHKPDPQN